MKIKGTQTETKVVTLDVTEKEVVDIFLNLFHKKYPNFVNNYVDENGFWQHFWFTDGHNGDDHYKPGNEATAEEVKLQQLKNMICNFMY